MTISVTQLNNYIHGLFEVDGVLSDVSVCGEITNVKRSQGGWYFSIKDEDSQIDCFCYYSATEPISGTLAVCEGNVNYYTKGGRISLFVRRLQITQNIGAQYLKFLELKDKLQKEGLFDEERKKVVPHSAETVGVVTSETGAVIHDICDVVMRRQPFTNIVLYPVKVQGIDADKEIAEGITFFNNSNVDVVIVGRGGGSGEDLSAFNSEIVVRAVANCCKQTVSAVGHGVDFTLCDFVADRRAVTPSEAAEFVTLDCSKIANSILNTLDAEENIVNHKLKELHSTVLYNISDISSIVNERLFKTRTTISNMVVDLNSVVQSKVDFVEYRIEKLTTTLSQLNPINTLKRGYGVVEHSGKKLKSADEVAIGDKIDITLVDGKISANVCEVIK